MNGWIGVKQGGGWGWGAGFDGMAAISRLLPLQIQGESKARTKWNHLLGKDADVDAPSPAPESNTAVSRTNNWSFEPPDAHVSCICKVQPTGFHTECRGKTAYDALDPSVSVGLRDGQKAGKIEWTRPSLGGPRPAHPNGISHGLVGWTDGPMR